MTSTGFKVTLLYYIFGGLFLWMFVYDAPKFMLFGVRCVFGCLRIHLSGMLRVRKRELNNHIPDFARYSVVFKLTRTEAHR